MRVYCRCPCGPPVIHIHKWFKTMRVSPAALGRRTLPLPLTPNCWNLIKQSAAARFAGGVQSVLPRSDSSERRSVLVLRPGCYQSPPPRGPRLPPWLLCCSFSFSVSVTLSGQCRYTLHIPRLYFKSFLPSVNGLCLGGGGGG